MTRHGRSGVAAGMLVGLMGASVLFPSAVRAYPAREVDALSRIQVVHTIRVAAQHVARTRPTYTGRMTDQRTTGTYSAAVRTSTSAARTPTYTTTAAARTRYTTRTYSAMSATAYGTRGTWRTDGATYARTATSVTGRYGSAPARTAGLGSGCPHGAHR